MYFKRKIDDILDSWVLTSEAKPLILRGARQVGKTESVRLLAQRKFTSCVEINFEKTPNLKDIFLEDLDPRRIIKRLEVLSGKRIEFGKTLVFFDEIQECPEAIKSLRYFHEELPQLHVISAGSLLELVLGSFSIPVGRVHYEYMYPMSFLEYLDAIGKSQYREYIPHLENYGPTDEFKNDAVVASSITQLLKEYFVVGGMPAAVKAYVRSQSFLDARQIHNDLMNSFFDDIGKHVSGDKQLQNIQQMFAKVFKSVGRQVVYTKFIEHEPVIRTKTSLHILQKLMLVHVVNSAQADGLPLGASANDKRFKLIFLDIGMSLTASGYDINEIFEARNLLPLFSGQLVEQFVGQQLLAESSPAASEGRRLYYWAREVKGASSEVDYLIVRKGKIIPVEIKSGPSGSLKSLHVYLKTFAGDGLCLQDRHDIRRHDRVSFAPWYAVL